jgi:NADH dehydrogenase
MSPRLAAKVHEALLAQGVDVRLQTQVAEVFAEGVTLVDRSRADERVEMPSALAFWAAGIRPNPVLAQLGLPQTESGWLAVGPTLQCFATPKPKHPDVFACGDAVRIQSAEGEWPTMQRAIECIWQAKVVVRNLLTLRQQPADYPNGVPPLRTHRLRRHFFYGVSVGSRSLIAYRGWSIDSARINRWFRRWLMQQYIARYDPHRRQLEAPAKPETA